MPTDVSPRYLGTDAPIGPGKFGRPYAATRLRRTRRSGDVEIWEILNLTGDTHPIHFHLVNVQILNRQAFNAASYSGTPALPRMLPYAARSQRNSAGRKR